MSLQDVLDAWDRVRTDLSRVCDCAECTDTRIPRQVLSEALSQHLEIMQWHGSRIRGYRIARSEALVISFFIREWRLPEWREALDWLLCYISILLYERIQQENKIDLNMARFQTAITRHHLF